MELASERKRQSVLRMEMEWVHIRLLLSKISDFYRFTNDNFSAIWYNRFYEEMILWLEEYLKNYRGTIIMVTHDRYFLDKVSNRILEISRGNIYSYEANYSRFLELKTVV